MTGTYQPAPEAVFREARAARMLSAEQQHPMTVAEWANKHDHVGAFIRDVPSSCSGAWTWEPGTARFTLIGHTAECAWHTGATPARMP